MSYVNLNSTEVSGAQVVRYTWRCLPFFIIARASVVFRLRPDALSHVTRLDWGSNSFALAPLYYGLMLLTIQSSTLTSSSLLLWHFKHKGENKIKMWGSIILLLPPTAPSSSCLTPFLLLLLPPPASCSYCSHLLLLPPNYYYTLLLLASATPSSSSSSSFLHSFPPHLLLLPLPPYNGLLSYVRS